MNSYLIGKALLDDGSLQEAKRAFQNGIELGDVRCHYGIAAICAIAKADMNLAEKNLAAVIGEIESLAIKGDPESCFIIGRCFEMGLCLEVSIERAVYYYEKAAKKEHPMALFNLGCLYMKHQPTLDAEAATVWKRAAELGNVRARIALEHLQKENGNIHPY